LDGSFNSRIFCVWGVCGNWSTVKNGGELSRQNRYWVCCGDGIDKKGVELIRLLLGKMRSIYDLLFKAFYGKLKTLHYNTRLLKYVIMRDGGALNEYI